MDYSVKLEILKIELSCLPGTKILQEISTFNDSLLILNQNFLEIEKHTKNFFHQGKTINPNLETKRVIHNYLASVVSLIDHTRVFVNSLHHEKEFIEYQQVIDETFIKNPLCNFVKDFRQYIQHYKIPDVSYQTNALSLKSKWSIRIRTEELESFSGWKKDSKRFLKDNYPKVDLLETLKSYQEIVTKFYEWLTIRQKEIFADEIRQVEVKINEIKEVRIYKLVSEIILNQNPFLEYYEKEFISIFSNDNLSDYKTQNSNERIVFMLEKLNVEEVIKPSLKVKLENLIL
jgi:hypothetical protein